MDAIRTRLSIWSVLLIVAMIAAGVWFVGAKTSSQSGVRSLQAQLLTNKNDGKDNCPNDGNAGKGNDSRCQTPGGGYGHVGNPNDGKDNCPNDGNAGKGNDNKGPNGGCRTK